MWVWYAVVLIFGIAIGTAELVARYRDDPWDALGSWPARIYIALNGAAAFFAYVLIVSFDWDFGASAGQKTWIQAMVAGFGSMAFFRSSLFTLRVGQTEMAVGPGVLFQILLNATDRGTDRSRAKPRSDIVTKIMQGVSFDAAQAALPNFCFELMQNVPETERLQFRTVVETLARQPMRDTVKAYNLGLMLLNVVGQRVLEAAVKAMGPQIQGPSKLEPVTLILLLQFDYKMALTTLPEMCCTMSNYRSLVDREQDRDEIVAEVAKLDASVDDRSRMLFLGLKLQERFGDAVLASAIQALPTQHIQSVAWAQRTTPAEPTGAGVTHGETTKTTKQPEIPEAATAEEPAAESKSGTVGLDGPGGPADQPVNQPKGAAAAEQPVPKGEQMPVVDAAKKPGDNEFVCRP